MTDLLLEDPGPNEEALDNRQETSLIEIMVSVPSEYLTRYDKEAKVSAAYLIAPPSDQHNEWVTWFLMKVATLAINVASRNSILLCWLLAITRPFTNIFGWSTCWQYKMAISHNL